ncbi:hypothetical protein ncot_09990 [Nocardioides sp. JQ2195]|uniref:hypothetical protein n=1 Tax=Nocardioides sp. JQ2195 TaxID=2592334 RepID=UPI00143E9D65|nr:hypothetical protein [Nocardioides sp. JQ2195]QIX26899.1 hypothetical protein ncot_09990 [Nocardioides sp. JQ2195]
MTSDDLLVPAGLGLVVLVLVVLLVLVTVGLRRERARSRAELEATREEAAELRQRVDALTHRIEVRTTPDEFVITDVGSRPDANDPDANDPGTNDPGASSAGDPERTDGPQRIEGKLFVDLVMRETVVKAASLTHGVRRALAPATRNRIRFAMKQEIKRSRKQRRIEFREVRREMAARRAAESADADRSEGRIEGAA